MVTERDVPTLHVHLQLAPRGDVRWDIVDGATEWRPLRPDEVGGFCLPDDTWQELRRELPVAIATWLHRLRRDQERDNGILPPRDSP